MYAEILCGHSSISDQSFISCIVRTAIWLECKRTEHHFGRVFLGLYANANSRRNSGRLVWWATCDRHITCAECDCHHAHSNRGEPVVLGGVHFAIYDWSSWSKTDCVRLNVSWIFFLEFCSFFRAVFFRQFKISYRNGRHPVRRGSSFRQWSAAHWAPLSRGQWQAGSWSIMDGLQRFMFRHSLHCCWLCFGFSSFSIGQQNIHEFLATRKPTSNAH